jgi:drug/metabolite transporter (DMT)-like permease
MLIPNLSSSLRPFLKSIVKKAYIQMHIAIFLWGFTGILGRLIELQEGLLVWYRMLITIIALFALIYFNGEFKRISWKDLKGISFIGAIMAIHWVTFYGAIKYSNISIALSCFSSTALFTAFIEPFMNKRRISKAELFFGVVTIIGIYLIFHFQKLYTTGIILALFSSFLCSIFTIKNKDLLGTHSPGNLMFYQLLSGFLVLSFILPLYLWALPVTKYLPDTSDWFYLMIFSLVCTVYALRLSYKALKVVTPFTMNLSVNLEPVYGIILAFLLFKEQKDLNAGFYAGTSLIILSVVVHSLYRFRNVRRERKLKATEKPIVLP